ncbi:MAG: 16S rRNA (guanine(527)-N(7))-methyltransferase RsmG [Candidatus Stahlbacteria bacterium]|nr:16S rRNA (guanine(527)-N(7))-methyltransferase RsmG [Candidatus Stahlbacteria bacterium]
MIAQELMAGASKIGISLSEEMIEKFKIYYKELLLWNKRMNLISRGDEQIVIRRHFLDSLQAVQCIPQNAKVLDIGSGAGFPGVPIKIARADIKLDLLEPKLKRFEFLDYLVNTLSLEVRIYRNRVEDLTYREYDIILSRSVGNLKWLTKVAVPILVSNGRVITYKGSRFEEEFKEVRGWEIEFRHPRSFCAGIIVGLKR